MSDRYIDFANSSLGHRLVAAIGLPSPVRLERWQAGRLRPVEGALLLGGGALASNVQCESIGQLRNKTAAQVAMRLNTGRTPSTRRAADTSPSWRLESTARRAAEKPIALRSRKASAVSGRPSVAISSSVVMISSIWRRNQGS